MEVGHIFYHWSHHCQGNAARLTCILDRENRHSRRLTVTGEVWEQNNSQQHLEHSVMARHWADINGAYVLPAVNDRFERREQNARWEIIFQKQPLLSEHCKWYLFSFASLVLTRNERVTLFNCAVITTKTTNLYCGILWGRHHDTEDWVEDNLGDRTPVATEGISLRGAGDPFFGVSFLSYRSS